MHALPRIADQSQSEGLFTESLMAAVAESTPEAQYAAARLPRRARRQGGEAGMSGVRYRDAQVGGCVEAVVERRRRRQHVVRSTEALRWFPERLTDCLEQWAARGAGPQLRRPPQGRRHGRATGATSPMPQMLQRAQAVGQSLVDLGLSPERPVAILSENDLEHLTLALGALWAGVPWVPVSTAYSLVSQDYGKLRHILATVTPGLVFASGPAYAKAIAATVDPDVDVVMTEGGIDGRSVRSFGSLLATPPGPSRRRRTCRRSAPTPSPSSCSPRARPSSPRA